MAYSGRKRRFGRKRDQRKALLRSLMRSVILNERIKTTEARAKGIRSPLEKLVTRARDNSLAMRRHLLAQFNNDEEVVKKLIDEIAPRFKDRPGGYTRITKVEARPGSGRRIAVIEFV